MWRPEQRPYRQGRPFKPEIDRPDDFDPDLPEPDDENEIGESEDGEEEVDSTEVFDDKWRFINGHSCKKRDHEYRQL
jgi:hypothetical protein